MRKLGIVNIMETNVKMIKFISADTSPSWHILAKIALVERLNALGVESRLYGDSYWPQKRSRFYSHLDEFKPLRGDIVINEGFLVDNLFELINVDYHRFPHGRKKRVLQVIKYIFNYFLQLPRSVGVQCINISKESDSSPRGWLFKISTLNDQKMAEEGLSVENLLKSEMLEPKINGDIVTICRDVESSGKAVRELYEHKTSRIYLAAAILSPSVFRQDIAPLLSQGNVYYSGFQLPTSDEYLSTAHSAKECINRWQKILN